MITSKLSEIYYCAFSSFLSVKGWAVPRNQYQLIRLKIGNTTLLPKLGILRLDVIKEFPNLDPVVHGACGWSFEGNFNEVSAPSILTVECVQDGAVIDNFKIRLSDDFTLTSYLQKSTDGKNLKVCGQKTFYQRLTPTEIDEIKSQMCGDNFTVISLRLTLDDLIVNAIPFYFHQSGKEMASATISDQQISLVPNIGHHENILLPSSIESSDLDYSQSDKQLRAIIVEKLKRQKTDLLKITGTNRISSLQIFNILLSLKSDMFASYVKFVLYPFPLAPRATGVISPSHWRKIYPTSDEYPSLKIYQDIYCVDDLKVGVYPIHSINEWQQSIFNKYNEQFHFTVYFIENYQEIGLMYPFILMAQRKF